MFDLRRFLSPERRAIDLEIGRFLDGQASSEALVGYNTKKRPASARANAPGRPSLLPRIPILIVRPGGAFVKFRRSTGQLSCGLIDPICWETTLLSMFSHDLFVTGDIDTIDFVIRNVALHPLNISP